MNGTDVKLHDYSNVLPAIMHVIRELQGFDFKSQLMASIYAEASFFATRTLLLLFSIVALLPAQALLSLSVSSGVLAVDLVSSTKVRHALQDIFNQDSSSSVDVGKENDFYSHNR